MHNPLPAPTVPNLRGFAPVGVLILVLFVVSSAPSIAARLITTDAESVTVEKVDTPQVATVDGYTLTWDDDDCVRHFNDIPYQTRFDCGDTSITVRDIDGIEDLDVTAMRATRSYLLSNDVPSDAQPVSDNPVVWVGSAAAAPTCALEYQQCSVTQSVVVVPSDAAVDSDGVVAGEPLVGVVVSFSAPVAEASTNPDAEPEIAQAQHLLDTDIARFSRSVTFTETPSHE